MYGATHTQTQTQKKYMPIANTHTHTHTQTPQMTHDPLYVLTPYGYHMSCVTSLKKADRYNVYIETHVPTLEIMDQV